MSRRPLLVALAAIALVVGGCRSDTIRTTGDGPTTSIAGRSATTAPGRSGRGSSTTTKVGAPATTAAAHPPGVVLGGGDLGATSLGAPADRAVAAVREALGPPTRDQKDPGSVCPGPDRLVRWGRLSLYFSGGSLGGWAYEATPAGPPDLATPSGITVGSTVATLRRVYGAKLSITPGDETVPPGFRVPLGSTALTGTLTGTADASTTTALFYGLGCGE